MAGWNLMRYVTLCKYRMLRGIMQARNCVWRAYISRYLRGAYRSIWLCLTRLYQSPFKVECTYMWMCTYTVARSLPIANAMRTCNPLSSRRYCSFLEDRTNSEGASDDEKETSVFFFVSVLVGIRDVSFNVVFQENDKWKRSGRIL